MINIPICGQVGPNKERSTSDPVPLVLAILIYPLPSTIFAVTQEQAIRLRIMSLNMLHESEVSFEASTVFISFRMFILSPNETFLKALKSR